MSKRDRWKPLLGPWEFALRLEQWGEWEEHGCDGLDDLRAYVSTCLATRTQVLGIVERGSREWSLVEIAELEGLARDDLGSISRAIADGRL